MSYLFFYIILIGGFILFVEILYSRGVDALVTRKIAHMGAGIIVCTFPLTITMEMTLIIGSIFTLLLYVSKARRIIPSIFESEGNNYGSVLFAPGLMLSALVFWNGDVHLFQLSVLILAFADSLAGYIGEKYGRLNYLPHNKKTLEGSLIFYIISSLILIAWVVFFKEVPIDNIPYLDIAFTALLLTAVEAVCNRGSDNLFLPVATAALTFLIVL